MDVASLMTLLLLALALAVQPWSVLAAVLLVTSEGGVAKTVAYVVGWVLALTAVAVVTIALYPETPQAASTSPWTSWAQIAAGVALGGWLLVRSRRPVVANPDSATTEVKPGEGQQLSSHPAGSQPAGSQPKWMARLDSMSLVPAFVLGAFLPNYAVVVAAVSNVIAAGLSQTQAIVAMVLFIIVASAGVAAPLLVLVFRRQDAPETYRRWRAWLIANGSGLMTVVLAVVAVVLIGKGIVGLVT